MKEKKRRRKKSPDTSEGEESKESNAKLKAVSKALETAPNPGGRKSCHENQSKGRYDSQLVIRFSLFLYPQSIRKQHFDSLTTVVSACVSAFPFISFCRPFRRRHMSVLHDCCVRFFRFLGEGRVLNLLLNVSFQKNPRRKKGEKERMLHSNFFFNFK